MYYGIICNDIDIWYICVYMFVSVFASECMQQILVCVWMCPCVLAYNFIHHLIVEDSSCLIWNKWSAVVSSCSPVKRAGVDGIWRNSAETGVWCQNRGIVFAYYWCSSKLSAYIQLVSVCLDDETFLQSARGCVLLFHVSFAAVPLDFFDITEHICAFEVDFHFRSGNSLKPPVHPFKCSRSSTKKSYNTMKGI